MSLNNNELLSFLDNIDFSDKFFEKDHYWAFRKTNWEDRSNKANKERKLVADRLIELHNNIYPLFQKYYLNDIHEHYVSQHITSSYFHKDGFTQDELSGLWLHYSKSHEEIRKYEKVFGVKVGIDEVNTVSFSNHMRLQIIVHNDSIGIWLYIGKANGGSLWDRGHIRDNINNAKFINDFFMLLGTLSSDYYMKIGNRTKRCSEVTSVTDLRQFWLYDNVNVASYLGIDFTAGSELLSRENIVQTVMQNFALLYPIYDHLRHKM